MVVIVVIFLDEKNRGVVFVDMGGGFIILFIFKDGEL